MTGEQSQEAKVNQLEALLLELAGKLENTATPERALETFVVRPTAQEVNKWNYFKIWNRIEEGYVAMKETWIGRRVVKDSPLEPTLYSGWSRKFPTSRFIKVSTRSLSVPLEEERYVTGDGQDIILSTQHFFRIKRMESGLLNPEAVYNVAYGVHDGLTQLPKTARAMIQSVIDNYTLKELLDETKKPGIYRQINTAFAQEHGNPIDNYGLECHQTIVGQMSLPAKLRDAYAEKVAADVYAETKNTRAKADADAMRTIAREARTQLTGLFNGYLDIIEQRYKDKPLDPAKAIEAAQQMMMTTASRLLPGAGADQNLLMTLGMGAKYAATDPGKTS